MNTPIIKEHLQAIFDSLTESHYFLDKDAKIIWFNKTAGIMSEKLFGNKFKVGKNILEYYPPERIHLFLEPFNKCINGRELTETISEVPIGNSRIWFLVAYNPVIDENNELLGVGMHIRDITTLKLGEEQLKKQKKVVADIAKIQSHILRRPLANIMGLTQIIKASNNPTDIKEVVEKLIQSVDELDTEVKKIVSQTATEDYIS